MKTIIYLLLLSLLSVSSGCNSIHAEQKITHAHETSFLQTGIPSIQEIPAPRIMYVVYGYYCGECYDDCTRMYKHYLAGNTRTFWTDKTDSYFKRGGLKCETKMTRESEIIGLSLVHQIPPSILSSEKARNIFGCPDCDDGCGLYFEIQLDEPDARPITYEMEYGLYGTTGEIKELGELMVKVIEQLEDFR